MNKDIIKKNLDDYIVNNYNLLASILTYTAKEYDYFTDAQLANHVEQNAIMLKELARKQGFVVIDGRDTDKFFRVKSRAVKEAANSSQQQLNALFSYNLIVADHFSEHGLYFNIIPSELERFYLEKSMSINGEKDIMKGLIFQEFRNVVICGSFENSLKYIDDIITVLKKRNITVLSPQSTKVKPETIGSNFILFDYQDGLKNERDTWRHKSEK